MILTIDHLVLTVASIERTCRFYENHLGMERKIFADGRTALHFGNHKINLHEKGREFEPGAGHPTTGSADLCFLVADIAATTRRLEETGIDLIEGPVPRTGARGAMISIYCRDPDGNLIELSQYE